LVAALKEIGAAGCNLEATEHVRRELRDPSRQADFLGAVRQAAADEGYALVINARIDEFLAAALSGSSESQERGWWTRPFAGRRLTSRPASTVCFRSRSGRRSR
jgi:hypothetical protein